MRRNLLLLTVLLLALTGCASHMVARKGKTAELRQSSRVAILPFENLSGKEQVATKVTEYFYVLMADEKKFSLIENGSIFEVMRQHRIRSSSLLTDSQIDSLASALQIDYLVTGAVLEYDEYDDNFLGKIPQVSFNTRVIDCRTHNTVWAAVSHGSGDKAEFLFGIGAVRSAEQLAEKMVQNVVATVTGLFSK
jgi:TolB-like protein